MLSREVDALRDALESQLGSEAEILSINDELRRRCEGAEQATERAERAMENVPAHLKQAVEAATAEADRDEDAMRE